MQTHITLNALRFVDVLLRQQLRTIFYRIKNTEIKEKENVKLIMAQDRVECFKTKTMIYIGESDRSFESEERRQGFDPFCSLRLVEEGRFE